MGVLDAPMAAVAKTMVKTFGRSATLKRYATPVYDDSTGKTSSGTATDVACSVVPLRAVDSHIPNTLIQSKDRLVLVARSVLGSRPVADRDELVLDGDTYAIKYVESHSSGASDAAYELLLRR